MGEKAVQMEIQQFVVDRELGGRKYRGREGCRLVSHSLFGMSILPTNHSPSLPPFFSVIDLDAMGFNGEEPEYLKMVRNTVKSQEPGLWEAVLKEDPLARKYMDDPMVVMKEISDLTSEYARNFEGKTTLDMGTASI